MSLPNHDKKPKPAFEKDPYPKMILVCIAITVLLLMIIFGVMFFDFFINQSEVEGFEPFDLPEDALPERITPIRESCIYITSCVNMC